MVRLLTRAGRCVVTALSVGVVVGVAGCAGLTSTAPSGPPAAEAAQGDQRLAGVCPPTVVVQTLWEPEAELGGIYQLLGSGARIDASAKRVSGPLLAAGKDTGVRIEVRAGGAAIGFTEVPAQMYLDRSITLGTVDEDLAIATSATAPVTAVLAPLVKSPQMLMWDPASHPSWRGIADIGASGVPVVVSKAKDFPAYLVGKGLLNPGQIDLGYTGSPARFVTDPTIAQQGYATQEPYSYAHEIPSWHKPVRYQLLADVGFTIYPQMLAIRTDDLAALTPCLRRLVPILQQAHIDYLTNPGPTNRLVVRTVAAYRDSWTYTPAVAAYAAATLKRLGIVANDTTGPLGGIDPARVQYAITTLAPLLTRSGTTVRPGLTPADITTASFINPTIALAR